MLSPLNTERIWLEKINVQLNPSYEETEAENYHLDVKINIRKRADALSFRVGLDMKLVPEDGAMCRYKQIATKTVGIFEMPEDTPEEYIRQVVPLNCLAILHGFARGVVAQITGLNDGGSFLLPTVNFIEAVKPKSKKTN